MDVGAVMVGTGSAMVEEKVRTRHAEGTGKRRLGLLVGRPRLDREGEDAVTMRQARKRDTNIQGAAGSAAAGCIDLCGLCARGYRFKAVSIRELKWCVRWLVREAGEVALPQPSIPMASITGR